MEGNVTLYNDRVLEIWGATKDDLFYTKGNKLNTETILSKVKDTKKYLKNSLSIFDNLEKETFDRFELIDGKTIERYTIPQVLEGNIIGRVASFRDITEQVKILKELQVTNEQLEETNTLAKLGGWELDLVNNKLSWSKITKEIHEVDEDFEPILETAINFYREGLSRERISEAVDYGVNFGIPWDLELQIVTPNGTFKWVRANGKPEFENGKCVRLYGTFQDINDRKLLDLALQESEEQHRILFDKNPLINITLDSDGIIISINDKGIAELGFSKDTLIGNSILQLFQTINIPIIENFINDCVNNIGETFTTVVDLLNYENNQLWLSLTATSFKNTNGEVIISIVCENITKEREIEAALLNSEANLRSVFESTEIGYVLFDTNLKVLTFNTTAYYLTIRQYKKELLQGNSIFDYIPEIRHEHIKGVTSEVFKGKRFEYEISQQNEFEDEMWYEVVYSPVKAKDETIVGMVMSMKDITQSKIIQKELNRTLSQVETTNKKLEEIIQQKDKFFSIIAHDLRSPFSGFIGLTDIIASEFNELSNEEIRTLTKELNKSANNLFKLLENLLEWSRMQRGLVNFNAEYLSLYEKVKKNIEFIDSKADLKAITIKNNVHVSAFVYADSQMLDVVLRNLISNAVKFTKVGGEVIISSKTIDNVVEVKVSDNGIGIPKDMLAGLFEIDSKSSRIGTAGEPSTGLGLMLCREYIEKHGGKIWAENNPKKGSSFYFTIYNSPTPN